MSLSDNAVMRTAASVFPVIILNYTPIVRFTVALSALDHGDACDNTEKLNIIHGIFFHRVMYFYVLCYGFHFSETAVGPAVVNC